MPHEEYLNVLLTQGFVERTRRCDVRDVALRMITQLPIVNIVEHTSKLPHPILNRKRVLPYHPHLLWNTAQHLQYPMVCNLKHSPIREFSHLVQELLFLE